MFQLTAARRRLASRAGGYAGNDGFNSQPPEGGWHRSLSGRRGRGRFNSQPPEGGWVLPRILSTTGLPFQLTAARRRLVFHQRLKPLPTRVSTHSRPKAAGRPLCFALIDVQVSTHSRPKAAGGEAEQTRWDFGVSTHSRPKAAGTVTGTSVYIERRFNSQPPEGGWEPPSSESEPPSSVSTHSRPKAAGCKTRESVC